MLINGDQQVYDRVLKSYTDTDDNQERKYAMFSLGNTSSEALRLRTLDWAVKSGEVKMQDIFYPIGSVASSLSGSELAWKYYQDNFNEIKEKLAKASPSIMDAVIVNAISRFCTVEKAEAIEAFFTANPLPSSARRISQTLENMRASAKMLAAIERSQHFGLNSVPVR
jgi:puromycin-sensitive aminopeptidase